MIAFVNAKINIGLQVVRRREDGYHDLQTVFYPVGLYAGQPDNPVSFCDIIEIDLIDSCVDGFTLETTGRNVDCELEKNLVWRAARAYFDRGTAAGFSVSIRLEKHLPDGAGMGGGSADAAFTLKLLRDLENEYRRGLNGNASITDIPLPDDVELSQMALGLGADCPFFILNRPAYAEGVGERLVPIDLDLSGMWLAVVKPVASVSTREAFAGIKPKAPDFDLRRLSEIPVEEWRNVAFNDFEQSIFPIHPEMKEIKDSLYRMGAKYASLTGSGSCIFGIFRNNAEARSALDYLGKIPTISSTYLLKL